MAWAIWSLAAVVLVLGLFIPPAFQAVQRALGRFGAWVGAALTWLLLVPFFYLVFMPGHFIMQVLKKDPLQLREASAASCWSERPPLKPDHFKKQF